MTDYWSTEESFVATAPVVGFFIAEDTTVVSGKGVKAGTSTANKLYVVVATKNTGFGIALKTVGTAEDPVPVLLRGMIKLVVGADGTTINKAQCFGTAGLLGDRTANTVNTFPTACYGLQTGSSTDEVVYLFGAG